MHAQAKQRKEVRLYYGTFNPSKTAYADAVPQWEAAGIKVKHVFSDDGHGYVQDAFQQVIQPALAPAVLIQC